MLYYFNAFLVIIMDPFSGFFIYFLHLTHHYCEIQSYCRLHPKLLSFMFCIFIFACPRGMTSYFYVHVLVTSIEKLVHAAYR